MARDVENFVMISGDAHRSVAADLELDFADPASRTVGAEFLGTSISSGGNGQDLDNLGVAWLAENPHMRFHNAQRGSQRCVLTRPSGAPTAGSSSRSARPSRRRERERPFRWRRAGPVAGADS